MADYFPLIVDAANSTIDELPAGDNLNLANSGIVNAGNITANFFIGDGSQLSNVPIGTALSNGNSSVNIPVASGNVNVTAAGNANILVITGTGANVTGTLGVSSNANVGNLGAAQVLASANVTAPRLISNVATGTAPLVVTSTTQVANLNAATAGAATNAAAVQTNASTATTVYPTFVTASTNANYALNTVSGISANLANNAITATTFVGSLSGAATSATTAGTVTTNAQPNITSVGTLTGLTVGNATANAVFGNGTITLNSGLITGNGNGLSSLQAANVTGTLPASVTNAISNVGTITSGTWNSTFTAGLNANTLANIQGANVSGAVGAATNATAVLTNASTATTVYLTGTSTAVNAHASLEKVTGISANMANNAITATTFVGTLSGAATTAGTVTTAAQPNITSVGTLTSLTASGGIVSTSATGRVALATDGGGSISLGLISGTASTPYIDFNSSATAVDYDARIQVSGNTGTVAGGTLTITAANTNVSAALNVTGNANVGNLGTAQVLATANITAPQLISNVTTGTAPFVVTSTTRVSNLNVAYANVADNINVTAPGTGTGYIVFANATTGNVAEWTSAGISSNLANNSITATTFVGALSGAATTAGTVTTAAQPNITSVGTLTSLGVNGTITAVAFTANTGVFTGNGSGLSQIAGGNVTGQVGNALVAGTVYTNAQPNITSVGTLSSLSVTANVDAGNLTTTGVLAVSGTGVSSIAGNLDMTSNTIINLATPTNPTDAATKQYVDDVAQGLNIHDSVQAATPTTLATITGGTITYNNGSSGVGANLTTTGSFNLIDGVNVQTAGTRILVKNEANAVYNGIYTWSNATVITRATDYNSVPEVEAGDFVFCTGGTLYDNTGWVQTSTVTAIGTAGNNIDFTQFSGAGTYTAGTGLTLSGTTFSISNTAVTAASYGNGDRVATFTVNNQGQLTAASNTVIAANAANLTGTTLASGITTSSLTTVGTLTSLSVTGNISAGNVSATTFTGALSGAATTAGTVTTAAQPNITSVTSSGGTFTVGNTSNGGIFMDRGQFVFNSYSGATEGGQIVMAWAGANGLTGQGNSTWNMDTDASNSYRLFYQNASGATGVSVTAYSSNNNVLLGNNLFVTSGVTASTLTSNVATGTAPFVVTSTTKVANLNVEQVDGYHAEIVSSASNIAVRDANADLFANNYVGRTFTSNVATGTAPLTVTSTTRVSNLNVAYANVADNINVTAPGTGTGYVVFANATTGNVAEWVSAGISSNLANNSITATTFVGALSGAATSATTAGTVTTNAQPNITSVGTLTSLAVTGAVTGDTFQSGNNGGGTNFKVGDDAWIGDVNTADTISIRGQQNAANGYIVFGNADSTTKLGRAGSGPLTYDAAFTANGNVTGANVVSTAYTIASVGTGISAAGTVQSNATAIGNMFNVVSTVTSGSGVRLPVAVAGMRITVLNTSANALAVYPATNGIINSAAANAAYSQPAGARLDYISTTSTQWYTLNATYG